MTGIMQAPGDPKKKKLLTPKRVNEIADSLEKESIEKKKLANQQKSIGDATVKNKVADKEIYVGAGKSLSGNDRLKIAEEARKSATIDSANAARYRRLAQSKGK